MSKNYSRYSIIGILLLFPWRDALAVMFHGTPIRIAEIWFAISAVLLLVCARRKYDIDSFLLLSIMLINFVETTVGILFNAGTIVVSFAVKYAVRNLFYLIVMMIILGSVYEVKEKHIEYLMVYLVWVQLLACLFTVITDKHLYFCRFISTHNTEDANYINIAGHMFHRFKGTCAEPGYLAPIIAIALYFFIVRYFSIESNQKKKNTSLCYIVILLFMSLFTFSSAVYIMDVLVILMAVATSKAVTRKYILICISGMLIGCVTIFILSNDYARSFFFSNFVDKIRYYLFRSKSAGFNYSAVDRSQHVDLAKRLIGNGNIFELLFGRGTGAYYYNSIKESGFLQSDVSEANNIYLSTLVDRGIVGLFCIISSFVVCYSKWIKTDIYSSTLFVGIIMQGFHWMVTGNFWLYYFEAYIILLFGYHKYKKAAIGVK